MFSAILLLHNLHSLVQDLADILPEASFSGINQTRTTFSRTAFRASISGSIRVHDLSPCMTFTCSTGELLLSMAERGENINEPLEEAQR